MFFRMLGRFTVVLLAAALSILGAAGQEGRHATPPRVDGPIEHLNRMSPEQRQRTLRKLPSARRATLEKRLEEYNALSRGSRQRLRARYSEFQKLGLERQKSLREAFREYNELPADRKPALRREMENLQVLSGDDRRARINSEEYRGEYSPSERKLIEEFSIEPGR